MLDHSNEALVEALTDRTRANHERHRARHYLRQRSPAGVGDTFVGVLEDGTEVEHLRFSLARELPRLDPETSAADARRLAELLASEEEPRALRREVYRTLRRLDSLPADVSETVASVSAAFEDEIASARRIAAVTEFAINALSVGRDRFGERDTPLFADGVHVDTLEPVRWVYDGNEWIVSNFASQQNFLRTLIGLTDLTGDERYSRAAAEATVHMFDEHQHSGGLLQWGGHRFVDLETGDAVHEFDNGFHELKAVFPFYDLLFEVDADAAAKLVRGMWEGHMQDWSEKFYHSRHGDWEDEPPDDVWDRPFDRPEPHQRIPRVGAMNHTSHDLQFAAAHAFAHVDDDGALTWAKRKADMWYRARNSETDLGSYYYHLEPTHYPGTDDHRGYEWPRFEEYGDAATSTRLWYSTGVPETIYTESALAKLQMAAVLGDDGDAFREWATSALVAFAESEAYDADENAINLLLTDGRVAEPNATDAGSRYFYAFSRGYRDTGDSRLWPVLRGVADGHGLGDVGTAPGENVALRSQTETADPVLLFGLLELDRAAETDAYLRLAEQIGDNILDERFHRGFFLPSAAHVNARFDAREPLALLALEAATRGEREQVPPYLSSNSIHGRYDGHGRTRDSRAIYSVTR